MIKWPGYIYIYSYQNQVWTRKIVWFYEFITPQRGKSQAESFFGKISRIGRIAILYPFLGVYSNVKRVVLSKWKWCHFEG